MKALICLMRKSGHNNDIGVRFSLPYRLQETHKVRKETPQTQNYSSIEPIGVDPTVHSDGITYLRYAQNQTITRYNLACSKPQTQSHENEKRVSRFSLPTTSSLPSQDNPQTAIPAQGWCGESLGRPAESKLFQTPGRADVRAGEGHAARRYCHRLQIWILFTVLRSPDKVWNSFFVITFLAERLWFFE